MNNEINEIWYFHHYASPLSMSGLGRPAHFGKYWTKTLKVIVFCASYLHYTNEQINKKKEKIKEIEENNVKYEFIHTRDSDKGIIYRLINMFQFYRGLFRQCKFFRKPDLIIASSPHPLTMIAGIKIAKRKNIPCICEIRDFWPEVIFLSGKIKEKSLLGKILLRYEHWIYKNADKLVFLKEGDYKYLVEKGWDINSGGDINIKKCNYINNGVDLDEFKTNSNKYILEDDDLNSEKFKVIYTGAIRPVNNVDNLVECANKLRNENNIEFIIFGDGNQLEELENKVESLKLSNIKFKGRVDKKYIPYILSKSSLNILNYSSEKYNWSRGNSSNKLFEYLASGKPVCSNIKMGYSIIQKYNCGIELEEDTVDNLSKAILKIAKLDKNKYNDLCNNAINAAIEFDYKHLAYNYYKLLLNTKLEYEGKKKNES